MFPSLVTSMLEDCTEGIILNWLTSKIFYESNYTQAFITQMLKDAGTLFFKAGVKDTSTTNNMWFDSNYGFRSYLGFQSWIKIAYFKKTISSGMGRYLITYFNIDKDTMANIVLNKDKSWMLQTAEGEICKYN